MALPKTSTELQLDLAERGRAHNERHKWGLADGVLTDAAEIIAKDRLEHSGAERYRPGVAEYLDLLAALRKADDPGGLLKKVAQFVLKKQAE
jgi:hypothetical protein